MKINPKTPSSFGGIYKNWETANKVGEGLKSKRWLNRIKDQLLDYRKNLKNDKISEPTRPSDLPIICSIYKVKTIVDFGGSSGWLWNYIKATNNDINIDKYNIVETKEVCNFMKKNKLHTKPVIYSTMKEYNESADIFYCNSVIQYFDKENFFLEFIKKINPKIILMEDLYVGNFKDFYTSQIYYEDRIPVKFRNMKKFFQLMNKIGYKSLFIKPYISAHRGIVQPIPMDKLPKNKRLEYAKTVLFKKK